MDRLRKRIWVNRCTLSLLLLLQALRSGATAKASSQSGQRDPTSAEAKRVDHAPKLDGTLDDSLWQSAEPIREFRQHEPREGEEATEKTEVRILYTRHAIYFGIYCHDTKPDQIIGTEL